MPEKEDILHIINTKKYKSKQYVTHESSHKIDTQLSPKFNSMHAGKIRRTRKQNNKRKRYTGYGLIYELDYLVIILRHIFRNPAMFTQTNLIGSEHLFKTTPGVPLVITLCTHGRK